MKKLGVMFLFLLTQLSYSKYGVDFTTGNTNSFDLSSYNTLLRATAKSMPYGVDSNGQPLHGEKMITAQVSKIEDSKIKGALKILSIQKINTASN